MPSGYTHSINEGENITFAQFASTCARAFGALVTLWDEPLSDQLPEKLEPAGFYSEKLQELENELARLKALPDGQAETEAKEEYSRKQASAKEHIVKAIEMQQRYSEMLEKAKAWQPPSEDHTGLKVFMIKQLSDSLGWDCDTGFWEERLSEPALSSSEWLKVQIAATEKDLAYYRNAYAEEIERTTKRNLWIQQLRDSLS